VTNVPRVLRLKKNYELEDFFRSDPYTKTGRDLAKTVFDGLTDENMGLFEKLFFKSEGGCYAEPHFVANESGDLYAKKNAFEKKLLRTNSFPLLFISGTAGSGKSTYLFKLMHDFKQKTNKNYDYVNIEIDTHRGYFKAANHKPFSGTDNNRGFNEFEFMIFCKIVDVINDFFDERNGFGDSAKQLFSSNMNIYVSKLSERIFSQEINILNWINTYDYWQNERDKEDFKLSIADEVGKLRNCDDIQESIIKLLQFMLIFFWLTFEGNRKKDYLFICFDGLEAYIGIENKTILLGSDDVKNIMGAIHSFVGQMEQSDSFLERFGVNFNNYFKILITLRDTTAKYLPKSLLSEQSTLIRKMTVDVTHWYHTNAVMDRKLATFEEMTLKHHILHTLISDESNETTLGNPLIGKLEKMFNYNKRDIIESVSYVVRKIREHGISCSQFIEIWQNQNGRFLLREAAIAISFRRLKEITFSKDAGHNRSYLDDLFFDDLCDDDIAKTYIQKILYFLVQTNGFVSIKELIKAIFIDPREFGIWKTPDNEVSKTSKIKFARVLLAMSNRYLLSHNFSPLIELNFEMQDKFHVDSDDELIGLLADYLCKLIANDSVDKKIKITPAGCFMAEYFSDYEFFACKIIEIDKYTPLVFCRTAKEITENLSQAYAYSVCLMRETIKHQHRTFGDDYRRIFRNKAHTYSKGEGEIVYTYPHKIIQAAVDYFGNYLGFLRSGSPLVHALQLEEIKNVVGEYLKRYSALKSSLEKGESDEIWIENGAALNFSADAGNGTKPHLKDKNNLPYGFNIRH